MSDAVREHRRHLRRSSVFAILVATLLLSSMSPSASATTATRDWAATAPRASAPPWGACGRSTPEDKIVRQFPGGITLRCGGPLGEVPRYGYRHIIARHQLDFENMAWETGTFQNWRDVADFAIETVAADPDVTTATNGNQLCLSRVVFLNNRQTGQLVRQQIVRVYIDAATRDVNSAHPRDRQC